MKFQQSLSVLGALATSAIACGDHDEASCYGPSIPGQHVRNVKRMQPDAQGAAYGPKGPLAWGQLNFLHTTDTHGWLEGHLKEQNYGADWGDFKSFVTGMRAQADSYNVDLLVVDTGDLHDGNGDSDATSPDGVLTNPIFENVDYDLLTIGNHELYLNDVAYLTATQFAKAYGERYVVSNVKILNNATGQYEYFAPQYRYFTTKHGLRVMAFGVLFDFTGNSAQSQVIPAATMIQQDWFKSAVNTSNPVDLFLLAGHNPVRGSGSTLTTIQKAIRQARPNTPIQVFGGHTHIRDFSVYDSGSTGLESGRYCETLGWLSMSGIQSSNYTGAANPPTLNPTTPAVKNVTSTATASAAPTSSANSTAFANLRFSRRYLDWNRATFAYHAVGSQSKSFDTKTGISVSNSITNLRKQLNLTSLLGCAPQTWCMSCQPFLSSGNIFSLLQTALSATVVNSTRADKPRLILINTGSVRFDLVEGPFTIDDSYIVSPFHDTFQYFPDVPYANAKQVIGILNGGAYQKRESVQELSTRDFAFNTVGGGDDCVNASLASHAEMLARRSSHAGQKTRGFVRRQSATLTPGYITSDDFGSDGDDTAHRAIPYYSQPNDLQANASFPTDGSTPDVVDLIFLDYIGPRYVLPALKKTGYTPPGAIQQYLAPDYLDTNTYLSKYVQMAFRNGTYPNCTVGNGVGY